MINSNLKYFYNIKFAKFSEAVTFISQRRLGFSYSGHKLFQLCNYFLIAVKILILDIRSEQTQS